MTVKELIEKLQKLENQDLEVFTYERRDRDCWERPIDEIYESNCLRHLCVPRIVIID